MHALLKTTLTFTINTTAAVGIILTATVINTVANMHLLGDNRAYAQTLDTIAAVINDDLIMRSELDSEITIERERLRQQNANNIAETELEAQVLENIISETLQIQRADAQNIRISETMLNNAIANIAENNNMSVAQLHQVIQNSGEKISTFRNRILRQITLQEIRNVEVNRRIKVTDAEIDRFLSSSQGQSLAEPDYLLAHILITVGANTDDSKKAEQTLQTIQEQLDAGAAFTDLAITYSDGNNAKQGGVLGWRRASQLPALFADVVALLDKGETSHPLRNNRGIHLIQVLDVRGTSTTTTEQTRARHILILPNNIRDEQATQTLAEDIYQRLQDGTPFAELAGTFSDDRRSALEGGDMGWLNAKQLPNFMQQQLDKLATGDFSPPFRGPNGWHLLQATERQTKNIGQELLRRQARKHLFDSKFAGELENWLRELRNQAYVEIR